VLFIDLIIFLANSPAIVSLPYDSNPLAVLTFIAARYSILFYLSWVLFEI